MQAHSFFAGIMQPLDALGQALHLHTYIRSIVQEIKLRNQCVDATESYVLILIPTVIRKGQVFG